MSIRRVEITEEKLRVGRETYYAGDIKSFPKEQADEFVERGWARDVETGEQGDRVPGAAPIKPDTVSQPVS